MGKKKSKLEDVDSHINYARQSNLVQSCSECLAVHSDIIMYIKNNLVYYNWVKRK